MVGMIGPKERAEDTIAKDIFMRHAAYRPPRCCDHTGVFWVLMASAVVVLSCTTSWAEPLRRLTGSQIRQQFTGRVLTDGAHWRETYTAGGKLIVTEMGHGTSTGSWRVDGDRLCKVRPGILSDCYEVWGAGNQIELRIDHAPPLEAFLRPATTK
jgi:hypothetical protein